MPFKDHTHPFRTMLLPRMTSFSLHPDWPIIHLLLPVWSHPMTQSDSTTLFNNFLGGDAGFMPFDIHRHLNSCIYPSQHPLHFVLMPLSHHPHHLQILLCICHSELHCQYYQCQARSSHSHHSGSLPAQQLSSCQSFPSMAMLLRDSMKSSIPLCSSSLSEDTFYEADDGQGESDLIFHGPALGVEVDHIQVQWMSSAIDWQLVNSDESSIPSHHCAPSSAYSSHPGTGHGHSADGAIGCYSRS